MSSRFQDIERRGRVVAGVCSKCEIIILHQLDSLQTQKHSVYYIQDINHDLPIEDGKPKCTLCSYIGSIFEAKRPPRTLEDWSTIRYRHATSMGPVEGENQGGLICSIDFGRRRSDRLEFVTCIESSTPNTSIWKYAVSPDPIRRLPTVKEWLEDCRQNHAHCIAWKSTYKSSNPTRLLKVSQPIPRLVHTSGQSLFAYAALSHCWGLGQPLKTTTHTLSQHLIEINPSMLPKTFQDAIAVTRELGLEYIWIDSLCIIQDDAQDWEAEAARMATIYESAEVTIAATWGTDGGSGCFHDYLPPTTIEVFKQDRDIPTMHSFHDRIKIRPRLDERRYLRNAPLNTRKWVLQERLLSLRTLIFAEDQMHWACASRLHSEDGLVSEEASPYTINTVLYHESDDDIDRRSYYQLQESWSMALQNYTSRKLTFPGDKLAAMAGISQTYHRIFGDEPILGLWKDDLARGLLWHTPAGATHPQLDDAAVTQLNIPSWCWAKIAGEVIGTTQYGAGPLIEITNTKVAWKGLPMTSKILEATITGRGKLLRITHLGKKTDASCMCGVSYIHLEYGNHLISNIPVYTWFLDQCVPQLADEKYCLLVYNNEVQTRWTTPKNPHMEISALLLGLPLNRQACPEYTRLGVIVFQEFPREVYDLAREDDFILV